MTRIFKSFFSVFIFYILILVILRQALIIVRGVEFEPITLEYIWNYLISYNGFEYTIRFISDFKDIISNFNGIIANFNGLSSLIDIIKNGFLGLFNLYKIIFSFGYIVMYSVLYVFNFIPYILGYEWSYFILG